MTENWATITGCPGCHEVSDQGNVRSVARRVVRSNGVPHTCRGGLLTPTIREDKYRVVTLHGKTFYVCRLVLTAFRGECPPGLECCHGPGGSLDDSLTNLRWDTRHANIMDAVRAGTHGQASKTRCSRGHEFTPENTRRRKDGGRDCRKCTTIRVREHRERIRVAAN